MKKETIHSEFSEQYSISESLSQLLELKKTTENKIAQDLNIPVISIRRLLSGETTDPRVSTLKSIADYFQIKIDQLLHLYPNIEGRLIADTIPSFVPLLPWDLSSAQEWIPVHFHKKQKISDQIFALESKPSMAPRIPIGSLLLIDPTLTPEDGDLALLKFKSNQELMLREIRIDPPQYQLYPLNEGGTVFPFSSTDYDIIGIVYLTLLYHRKRHPLHHE